MKKGTVSALALITALLSCPVEGSVVPTSHQPGLSLETEGQILWQARNDAAIPGDTGTRFDMKSLLSSPVPAYRFEAGFLFAERHQLRAVLAPLTLEDRGELTEQVNFQGMVFGAGVTTEGTFKFNSYRATYRYGFLQNDDWSLWAGVTLKVRDAIIRLRQGSIVQEKKNIGIVPLIHGAVAYRLIPSWYAELEFDALAAPQGRAEDVRLGVRRKFSTPGFSVAVGYRILEGGADNKTVYTFSLFHYAFVSAGYEF